MPTLQLGKELLYNYPIPVFFAGFKSDTYALGKAGWDLSMQQGLSSYSFEYEMRLAMRMGERNNAMYAISHPLLLSPELTHAILAGPNHNGLGGLAFHIMSLAPDIRFAIQSEMNVAGSFADSFHPVSSMPMRRENIVESIADFKFFKTAKPDVKDLIVTPEQVPELLDLIIKTQKPTQEQIRSRNKSRENHSRYSGGDFQVKPTHTVQAQIITLAG